MAIYYNLKLKMFSSKLQSLIAKRALLGNNTKRLFSSVNNGPKMGAGNTLALGAAGLGICGITYLSW